MITKKVAIERAAQVAKAGRVLLRFVEGGQLQRIAADVARGGSALEAIEDAITDMREERESRGRSRP